MKSSYTFKATAKATDYQRICRENPEATFLVVKSEGVLPLTFVKCYSPEHFALRSRAGQHASGRIEGIGTTSTYVIFDGDQSSILAPKVRTTVEVY